MPVLAFVVLGLCAGLARAVLITQQKQFFTDFCLSTNIALFPLSSRWCVPATNPCTWSGVVCDTLTGSVVEKLAIDFETPLPLTGTMPDSLGNFASLVEFSLYCANSFFTGTIGERFFENNNETLRKFTVTECPLLLGTVPEGFGLPALTHWLVSGTSFGTALSPVFLTQSLALVEFVLSRSNLTGPVPDVFAGLVHLEKLDLSANRITGGVPESLCVTPSLEVLLLQQNYLNQYPACLGTTLNPTVICDLRENYYCTTTTPSDLSDLLPCLILSPLCDEIPEPDICGVCGGDGSTCVGCDGIPDSGLELNECGVCDGPPNPGPCPDCEGVIGGTATYDVCGVCDGDGRSCVDCDGVTYGTSEPDACGVCNGDDASCTDCQGLLFGTAEYDLCDICDGDSDTCNDCSGTPGGSKTIDACGACGGDGVACLDCLGVANGTRVYDVCDVCGGDGTSCGIEFIRAQTATRGTIFGTTMLLLIMVLVAVLCPLLLCALWFREWSR